MPGDQGSMWNTTPRPEVSREELKGLVLQMLIGNHAPESRGTMEDVYFQSMGIASNLVKEAINALITEGKISEKDGLLSPIK